MLDGFSSYYVYAGVTLLLIVLGVYMIYFDGKKIFQQKDIKTLSVATLFVALTIVLFWIYLASSNNTLFSVENLFLGYKLLIFLTVVTLLLMKGYQGSDVKNRFKVITYVGMICAWSFVSSLYIMRVFLENLTTISYLLFIPIVIVFGIVFTLAVIVYYIA